MKMYPQNKPKKPVGKSLKKDEPSFFDSVYAVVRQIPHGRVTTYGAVAEATGLRMSARMVGWALNGCGHVRPKVPAHRVVNRLGILSGRHHFATPTLMQELLEQEGVEVKDDTVVDFKRLFWDPRMA
jgi:methylated-DNA-protein-cysteine methyltransferase-like protein